jgi:hypothetical protein
VSKVSSLRQPANTDIAGETANGMPMLKIADSSEDDSVMVSIDRDPHIESESADNTLPTATPRGLSSKFDLVPFPESDPELFQLSEADKVRLPSTPTMYILISNRKQSAGPLSESLLTTCRFHAASPAATTSGTRTGAPTVNT